MYAVKAIEKTGKTEEVIKEVIAAKCVRIHDDGTVNVQKKRSE